MKKVLVTFIALMLLLSVSVSAVSVEFVIGDATMAKVQNETPDRNLETAPLLAAPYIENDRTMVPIRAISESFDCKVGWDPDTRKVTVTSADKEINLFIDSKAAYVNGQEITLDVAPVIRGDITFVPVRFVTENMGLNVEYIADVRSVLIFDKPNIEQNGQKAAYPFFDACNYFIYATNGTYPSASEFKTTESLVLYYSELATIAAANNITVDDGYLMTQEDLKDCYNNNLLKGECASLLKAFGYEDTLMEYYAKNNIDEINAKYAESYVCAKHVLVPDLATANKVYKEAKAGKNFDELIMQYGQDPGMQKNPDGYVFTKGEMVKPFEDAAFALGEDEISKPVKTDYGYHIIKRIKLPELTDQKMYELVNQMYLIPILEKYIQE